ncbi:integral membrane protein [Paramyrothecium foliicola]|nr:integral membrane protein [Paramyrothecium foliicola]
MSWTGTTATELQLSAVLGIHDDAHELNNLYKKGHGHQLGSYTESAALDNEAAQAVETSAKPVAPSKLKTIGIFITLACVSLLNTFNSGMLVVILPVMARELAVPDHLLLWPASVYSLALSCCLLPMGAIADLVGNRPVFLTGSFLYTAFTLAVSLARSGDQLIAFRTLQGIAMAFCMAPAVSTIASTFPSGRTRNSAFAVFGGGNPVGFALGLVLGGVFFQISSWRVGYWMSTSINGLSIAMAFFVLPRRCAEDRLTLKELRHRVIADLVWVGIITASTCLALLSYLFAEKTHGAGRVMRKIPHAIALLVIAALLIPFFVFWKSRQERLGRPAVLPNSVWKRREFTSVCIVVFLTWSWFNSFGYWATLYYQVTQGLDSMQTALRFLPLVAAGLLLSRR